MKTCNGQVACEPFKVRHVEAEVSRGFASAAQKRSLTGLVVVFPDFEGRYSPGGTIYVQSDQFATNWAGKDYELEGKRFIIVPLSSVQLYQPPSDA